ncbi:hypothetical protein C4D60_Mb05t21670 [Musa balbisiana]|uniref:AB hydrolase-1 domain-containing protein n=1 Tax=Musa balbisiana TaxID=52838 RepID=A0A4V4H8C3_MUSBA|nr:hypothetical protein C4D60_Mb05t21670 [Musa balbisiana]
MVDKEEHSYLDTRGLSLHIAHVGKGELGAVLFIHGFPEIWYSWRHQMNAVAKAGFTAIAPDLRSYGLSTQPSEPEKTTWEDLVADLLAILNFLSISKLRKDRRSWTLQTHLLLCHSGSLRKISMPILLYMRNLGFIFLSKCHTGHCIGEQPDPKIEVPVLLIMGEKDYAFKFPGMENYVRSGTLKHFVPDLEIKYIPEGSHFVQEQFPDQVNQLVITFLKNHI